MDVSCIASCLNLLCLDVLVSPIRQAKRLTDLTANETADMFNVAKKVQKALEEHYTVNSSTVCIQDGADAGQTVPVSKVLSYE